MEQANFSAREPVITWRSLTEQENNILLAYKKKYFYSTYIFKQELPHFKFIAKNSLLQNVFKMFVCCYIVLPWQHICQFCEGAMYHKIIYVAG